MNLICLYNPSCRLPLSPLISKLDKQTQHEMPHSSTHKAFWYGLTLYEGCRGPWLIAQVGSGEKWKSCICILICPQSGFVFGVAEKSPGVRPSSLFTGAP